jgi:DNA-binding GntR family transcriptional regulator
MGKNRALFSPMRGHASFKEQAVELLSDRIISGKIPPGERLNESSLSEQFQISRAPIREALQQLLEQGLVVNVPRRGMFVVSLETEDVQKINSLRVVLESEALRLVRLSGAPQDAQKLSRILEKMEKTEPGPTNESVRLDMEFHRAIWSFTGNEYLEKTLTSLTAPLFAHRMVTQLQAGTQRMVLDSHRPLYEFVIGKSKQTAEAVMLAHLTLRWPDPARYSSFRSKDAAQPSASK